MDKNLLTVVDLFAGTGAFSVAFESTNKFKTIYANDFDKNSKAIFEENFPLKTFISDDLLTIDVTSMPKMDVLTSGFPCQPYSMAGERKGFSDQRSNVFWKIVEIIKAKNPRFVVLENVKNLCSHDDGKTFKIIMNALENDCKYFVKHKILNTCEITKIPQNRERIFIVCFKNKSDHDAFNFPNILKDKDNKICPFPIKSMLDKGTIDDCFYYDSRYIPWPLIQQGINKDISTNTVYQWRKNYVRENKSNVCPTLTANMGSGGHNVPLIMELDGRIRKLTPRECFRLQGLPDSYKFPKGMSNASLYKLAGNAITMTVARAIAKNLAELI